MLLIIRWEVVLLVWIWALTALCLHLIYEIGTPAENDYLYIIKIFPTVCHRLFLLFGFEGYTSNHARFTLDSLESMQIKRLETCQDGRDKISGAWNYCLLESTTMTRFCASVCVSEKWTHIISLSIAFSEESAFAKCRSSQLSNARETLACMHDTR